MPRQFQKVGNLVECAARLVQELTAVENQELFAIEVLQVVLDLLGVQAGPHKAHLRAKRGIVDRFQFPAHGLFKRRKSVAAI